MRFFLREQTYPLIGHPKQQSSIQKPYHHQPLSGANWHLRLHDKGVAGQGTRAGQKIESAVLSDEPDSKPQGCKKQTKNPKGLDVASPGEGWRSRGRYIWTDIGRAFKCLVRCRFHHAPHRLAGGFQSLDDVVRRLAHSPLQACLACVRPIRGGICHAPDGLAGKTRIQRGEQGLNQAASPFQSGL